MNRAKKFVIAGIISFSCFVNVYGQAPRNATSKNNFIVTKNSLPNPTPEKLPRWRGFNLLEKFQDKPDELTAIAPIWSYNNQPFQESDFRMISEWGFDFVRLPMSYKCWVREDNPTIFREEILKDIDLAVAWGKKYGIHVCLNFHRAPGWCITPPKEDKSIWDNDSVLNVCATHWAMFAKRYKGIPNSQLSFDLLNEPNTSPEKYYKVVKRLCEAIRAADPNRLIICDGNNVGVMPTPELIPLKVAQSGRAYAPAFISHYKTTWAGMPDLNYIPTWPGYDPVNNEYWDKKTLAEYFVSWITFKNRNVGVHIGEWGVFNRTSKQTTLAFMEDVLSILKENDLGWALWNFRGTFGVLDSNRADVVYEDYQGHRLDRDMLTLLQKY